MGTGCVWANTRKNRLYVYLSGFFSNEETFSIGEQIITESKKLKKGFNTIADIKDSYPANQEDIERIQQIQSYLKIHGMNKVVRVVGDAHMSNMQLNRMAREAGYRGETAPSLAAAEQILRYT